ncbi:DoxX family protein [Mycolicibacterium vaccae]|uniref:DoxX family protein n=1 Tax=Mycolicibacterium vaccae ATCC 25954 TaxID=1194972 RepID=K0UQJ8_MYCVA|nr:DoxX family protein [Mycolicibacterium vaccae]ANI41443.1 DoxX family protein [Mycolicibacterium vaccae 95051]EJZ04858.1 DoxX family protein [Mycolicibacterium vaccae ATCC 25954]
MTETPIRIGSTTDGIDLGLLILRLGIGAAVLQAGLIKVADFSMTAQFMADADWRVPTFAALMVTATEILSGLALLLGVLTPLAGCAALGAMLCAWAVNVSGAAFWSEPFNVPFLLGLGAATLIFTGPGRYSIDSRVLGRVTWSLRVKVLLVVLALAVAAATWVALYGVNPIHFTAPQPQ